LQERRHIQDMAQVYKPINNFDKVSRVKLFDHVPEGQTRLAADPLNIRSELCRTDTRKNFFTQRVINAWNSIDSALKSSVNVHVFKSNYRKTRLDGTP
jgi:hypothetical protein